MSCDKEQISTEREFQLEILKAQINHDYFMSTFTTILAIEVSAFVSLATTYLIFGLTVTNLFYITIAVVILSVLGILLFATGLYFRSKKVKEIFKKNLEEELQPIRNRFNIRTPDNTTS